MRPLAVELAFDQASDQRLGRMWSRLLELYGGPKDSELGVRPHITLALFRSGEPRNAADLIQSLAKEVAPFDLKLAVADRFPTSEGVVFLRPEPSQALTRAHAILHELRGADRGLVHAYYRPPAWSPHSTMAINVAEPFIDAVLSACSQAVGEVRVARIQLVRYRRATEIAGALLGQRETVQPPKAAVGTTRRRCAGR